MASNLKNFIVLLPSGHRQNMKVSWDTSILQMLEDVCKKNGLKSEEYDLKHHNTILDPSTVIRYSALPNNAFLEMVPCREQRKVSAVTVSVQLDSNAERLTGEFMPNVDLKNIMQTLCPETLVDTSKVPVVVFMRREIIGFNKLSSTTLQELGVTSGRILLRFTTRESEKHPELQLVGSAVLNPVKPPSVAADVDKSSVAGQSQEKQKITGSHLEAKTFSTNETKSLSIDHKDTTADQLPKKCIDETTEKKIVEPQQPSCELKRPCLVSEKLKKDDNPIQKVVNNSPSTVHQIDPSPLKDIDLSKIKYVDEKRKILIFHLKDENSTTEELPDDFFDITVDDVRLMMRDLKRTREEMENTPLLTGSLRENESQRKLEIYKDTVIRIQFPDRYVLQGVFKPNDLFSEVIQCVKQSLSRPDTNFYLYTSPPKRILLPEETLFSADCVPCAKIYFGTGNISEDAQNRGYLKEDLNSFITSRSLATLAACQTRNIRPNTSLRREVKEDSEELAQACSSTQPAKHQACATVQPTTSDSSTSNKLFKSKDNTTTNEKVPKWFKPL